MEENAENERRQAGALALRIVFHNAETAGQAVIVQGTSRDKAPGIEMEEV